MNGKNFLKHLLSLTGRKVKISESHELVYIDVLQSENVNTEL